MTAILATHRSVVVNLPRRLHQQIERRVPHSSTLRSTLVRDLERYYWLMDASGDRWRHDDHHAYLLALAEVDVPTRTLDDLRAWPARARDAVRAANLHLVHHFDVQAFAAWLRAETAEPVTLLMLLDLLDCMRNTAAEAATLDP
jgi:hypothetical protein